MSIINWDERNIGSNGLYQLLILSNIKDLFEDKKFKYDGMSKKLSPAGICDLLLICIKKSLSTIDLEGLSLTLFKLFIHVSILDINSSYLSSLILLSSRSEIKSILVLSNSLSNSTLILMRKIKSDISINVVKEDFIPQILFWSNPELNFSNKYSDLRKFLIFSVTGCSYIINSFII